MFAWARRLWRATGPDPVAREIVEAVNGLRNPDPVPVPEIAPAPERPDPPPLVAAMAKPPNALGCVEVTPPGRREHANGFTLECVAFQSREELDDYCKRVPLVTGLNARFSPPPDATLAERAVYNEVFRRMTEEDRAALYARGGCAMVVETCMDAARRMLAADAAKPRAE